MAEVQARLHHYELFTELKEHPGWKAFEEALAHMVRSAQVDVDRRPSPEEQAGARYWALGYWAALKNVQAYLPLAIQMARPREEERAERARG